MPTGCCEVCLSHDFQGLERSRADRGYHGPQIISYSILPYRRQVQSLALIVSTPQDMVSLSDQGEEAIRGILVITINALSLANLTPAPVDGSSGEREDTWPGFWRHQRRTRVVLDICRY